MARGGGADVRKEVGERCVECVTCQVCVQCLVNDLHMCGRVLGFLEVCGDALAAL